MAERICSVPGCGRKHMGHGWCRSHLYRVRKHGTPSADVPLSRRKPHFGAVDRETLFWSLVDKRGETECWPWSGSYGGNGYGRFHVDHGRGPAMNASRAAFLYAYGYLPPVVRHTCDNPPCCNPQHLLPGTQKENMEDCAQRGRSTRGARNPAAKLNPDAVRDIRRRRAAGEKCDSIAATYGVSPTQVTSIMKGTTWSHVQ